MWITVGVALCLHVILMLGSAWTERTRLTLLRPASKEITVQVDEPEVDTAPIVTKGRA